MRERSLRAHHVTGVWVHEAWLSSPNGYVRGNTVRYAPGYAPLVRALPTRSVGIDDPAVMAIGIKGRHLRKVFRNDEYGHILNKIKWRQKSAGIDKINRFHSFVEQIYLIKLSYLPTNGTAVQVPTSVNAANRFNWFSSTR
jgi:hypothetical protein